MNWVTSPLVVPILKTRTGPGQRVWGRLLPILLCFEGPSELVAFRLLRY
jgi:hypothetical protein